MKNDEFRQLVLAVVGHAALQTNPVVTAASGGLAIVRQLYSERAEHVFQTACDNLVREVAALQQFPVHDPEEQARRFEETIQSATPEALDAMFEAFRSMLSAIDPAAQPFIARLAARHIVERKPRDWFFRRAGGLLTNVSERSVAEIVGIARALKGISEVHFGGFPLGFQHLTECCVLLDYWLPGYAPPPTKVEIRIPTNDDGVNRTFEAPSVSFETAELLIQALLVDQVQRTTQSITLIWFLASPECFNRFVGFFSE